MIAWNGVYEAPETFDTWIAYLEEDVIQGQYGFEPGEFTVYREHWRPHFDQGLSPEEAFRRALDASAESRREREAQRKADWARIQAADAALIAATKADAPAPDNPAEATQG